ncbi:MAG TPA: alpha/beta fold hydrolase [Vineibacter sp.]|nr:alpha/beta fold hydrolase [Vineibacter sp.]
MSATAATREPDVGARFQAEIDRSIQRYVKGLEFLSTPPPPVGSSPKEVIHSRGTLMLYHYRPMVDEIYRVPVLLVMATTNKSYIFDLAPGQSLVEFLLKRGYDVYVMDWNAPRPEEKSLRIEDYVLDFIPDCVERVQKTSGETDVSVVGYCQGGVLSSMYAAAHPRGPLKNLVCFTTPIDFTKMGLFAIWSDKRHFDVDRLIDTFGNMPPEIISTSFDMLRPATRTATQIQVWEKMWDDEYIKSYRMFDRWGVEMLPLAGEYFRQTVKEMMWNNSLYKGTLVLGGRQINLRNITVPILHVVAEHDHIVPFEASKPLIELVGSQDKEQVMLKGGHVSVIAGPNAVKRMWPKLDEWLGVRSV